MKIIIRGKPMLYYSAVAATPPPPPNQVKFLEAKINVLEKLRSCSVSCIHIGGLDLSRYYRLFLKKKAYGKVF